MKLLVVSTFFALGMGMLFSIQAARSSDSPRMQAVIPAALAFIAVGQLGTAVMILVRGQEQRIKELERLLAERGS